MANYNLAVIGAGPGGYVSAIRATQLGMKTVIVEKEFWGGVCLNVGCIPSKCLLEDTHLLYELNNSAERGIKTKGLEVRWEEIQMRKEKVVKQFTEGVQFLLKKNGVDMKIGSARFVDSGRLKIISPAEHEAEVSADFFLIATGGRPAELPHIKIDHEFVIDSTDALSLKEIPKKLLIIGAGAIGLELGSVYARLGSEVVNVEIMPECLPGTDKEIAGALRRELEKQGLKIHLDSKVDEVQMKGKGLTVKVSGKFNGEISADKVLLSVGRVPNTENLGLERAGVNVEKRGFILVNENFQTSSPNIYAIGDVIGGKQLAHKASYEGECAVEIMAGHKPYLHRPIAGVVYTSPEVASVGLSEDEAKEKGLNIKVGKFLFRANGRALSMNAPAGLAKVIANRDTDEVIGVHILGPYAGELIAEAVMAMTLGASLEEYQLAVRAHPTLSEALREASLSSEKRAIHKVD